MLILMKQGRPTDRQRTDFGERLAQAREQGGLTQVQLAGKMGVTQRAVVHWERATVALRPEQLHALADILRVSTDYLVGREDLHPKATKGPPGKLRHVFEKAHQLPRHEQNQIVKFVEAYISQYAAKAG
jgi:transcriptional regulator with XRE-family HTH domain